MAVHSCCPAGRVCAWRVVMQTQAMARVRRSHRHRRCLQSSQSCAVQARARSSARARVAAWAQAQAPARKVGSCDCQCVSNLQVFPAESHRWSCRTIGSGSGSGPGSSSGSGSGSGSGTGRARWRLEICWRDVGSGAGSWSDLAYQRVQCGILGSRSARVGRQSSPGCSAPVLFTDMVSGQRCQG